MIPSLSEFASFWVQTRKIMIVGFNKSIGAPIDVVGASSQEIDSLAPRTLGMMFTLSGRAKRMTSYKAT